MTPEPNAHQAGWRALLKDLLDEPEAPPAACAAMLKNLDLYVSDELDGVDVQARHPALWAHLRTCPTCRAEYLSLLDLLRAEQSGAIPPVPTPETWRLALEPIQGRPEPALAFVFAPVYLRQSLRGPLGQRLGRAQRGGRPGETAPDRSADAPAEGVLLLSQLTDTPAGEVLVTLHARPVAARDADGREQALLVLHAVGDYSPSRAELTWAGQLWQAAIGPDGLATLGPVPLAALDREAGAGAFLLRIVP